MVEATDEMNAWEGKNIYLYKQAKDKAIAEQSKETSIAKEKPKAVKKTKAVKRTAKKK